MKEHPIQIDLGHRSKRYFTQDKRLPYPRLERSKAPHFRTIPT